MILKSENKNDLCFPQLSVDKFKLCYRGGRELNRDKKILPNYG